MSTNEELYCKLELALDKGDAGARAMRLAKFAGIFANENRSEVILRLLQSDSLPAGQAWPSSVTPSSRWKHLKAFREFLQIERHKQNEALYRVDLDNKRRLQQVVDSLETLADATEARTNPTIRVSFEDDGFCIIQTPEKVVRVERSKLLGMLALVLESIPE